MLRLLSILLLLLLALPVLSIELQSGNNIVIGPEQVIDDDLLVTGSHILVQGKVTGDVVAAGSDVQISGPVGGDVIVASGNTTVDGPVAGSLYVASGNVTLNSTVGRNAAVGSGNLIVNREARITRDMAVGAGTATVSGNVARDLLAGVGTLTLTDTARIGRNVNAQINESHIASGATIGGQRNITQAPEHEKRRGAGIGGLILFSLLFGTSLLLVGLPFVALAPVLTEQTETMLKTHPWVSLLAGFLVFLITPMVLFVIGITCIGLPLALILWALYTIAMFLGPIFVAILAGRLILRNSAARLPISLLIGIGVLILLLWIPFLGFTVLLASMLFGMGALLLSLQARTGNPLIRETPPPARAE